MSTRLPITEADRATLRHWVAIYRERGYQPLPSRMDEKRPMCKFADLWSACSLSDPFDGCDTTNVQVICGRAWGLLVTDLDGLEARERFGRRSVPRTWTVTSGGDGRHLWFRVPRDGRPLQKAVLWTGEGEHSAIERLCDQSLVIAPPSIHPRTGRRYTWTSRAESPIGMTLPAPAPDWLLAWRPVGCKAKLPRPIRVNLPVGNVAALVRSWGVRIAGQPSAKGWLPVHAIDREDRHPSAAVHVESGVYVDQGSGLKLSLPDLAVHLGVYRDRGEALDALRGHHA